MEVLLIVDGAYYCFDLAQYAFGKGIEIIPGQLTGNSPDSEKMDYSKNFVSDEDQ